MTFRLTAPSITADIKAPFTDGEGNTIDANITMEVAKRL